MTESWHFIVIYFCKLKDKPRKVSANQQATSSRICQMEDLVVAESRIIAICSEWSNKH